MPNIINNLSANENLYFHVFDLEMKIIIRAVLMLGLIIHHHYTYAQAGSLDLSFGNNGKVATSLSVTGHSYASATAIQPDGKIVVAGYTYLGNNIDFGLSRYNTDGSLDLTFDTDGKVTTDIGDSLDFCYAIAIQADGKLVAVGSTANYSKVAVVRYNTNGSLDNTFDIDGMLTVGMLGSAIQGYAAAIQADGKIVIAAQRFAGANMDFCIIRLNTNGSYDVSFDTDGMVTTNINGDDYAYAIGLQTDGKIVVAGSSNTDFSVVRYTTNGSLDSTFDADGKVITSVSIGTDMATSMTIQSDGRIILAGNTNVAGNVHALVRYTTNGSLDTSFDTDGIVLTSNVCSIYGVKIQNDGKIIAVGSYAVGSSMDFVVVRYNTNGMLDSSFDTDGVVTTDFGFGKDDFAYATAIQNDGKIVVVGHGYNVSYNNFMVMRYNPGVATNLHTTSVQSYTIYPNPTKGLLTIQLPVNEYKIILFNAFGQAVYTGNSHTHQSLVDLQQLSNGVYMVQLQWDSNSCTVKLIKE
jgi:uncharacterized delta-60 repeat protein